jgi:hypothetical protein
VQIAFDTAPGVIGGRDDPYPKRGEFGVGLGVGDRGHDQIRKVRHARLGVGRQGFGSRRADDGRPPHPPVDDDGRTHRHAEAHITEACGDGTGSILVAVHPGGAAGAQDHRGDVVSSSENRVPTGIFSNPGSSSQAASRVAVPSGW